MAIVGFVASMLLDCKVEAFPVSRRNSINGVLNASSKMELKEDSLFEAYDETRRALTGIPALIAAGTVSFDPLHALAATPMTAGEADNVGARLTRQIRPRAPKILRSKIDQNFAVLLMRSSYNALDKIDCVAMDQFQRDFFLIRQAEYQPYVNQLGPGVVQQGMLTDPNYFDFISFAQYTTINREINANPPLVFEEQEPENAGEDEPQKFVTKVVKRDPLLTNDLLAKEHSKLVGIDIIDKLNENFGSTALQIPAIPRKFDADAILASLSRLAKLFVLNGFAMGADVSISKIKGPSEIQYRIILKSPANLWSGMALQQIKADPLNCFLLKAATELVNRSGFIVSLSSVKYQQNQEITFMTIR